MSRDDLGRAAYEEWKFCGGHIHEMARRDGNGRDSESKSARLKCGGYEFDVDFTVDVRPSKATQEPEPGCRWIDLTKDQQEIWCRVGEAVAQKLAVPV